MLGKSRAGPSNTTRSQSDAGEAADEGSQLEGAAGSPRSAGDGLTWRGEGRDQVCPPDESLPFFDCSHWKVVADPGRRDASTSGGPTRACMAPSMLPDRIGHSQEQCRDAGKAAAIGQLHCCRAVLGLRGCPFPPQQSPAPLAFQKSTPSVLQVAPSGWQGMAALGPCRGRQEQQVCPRVAEEVMVRHVQQRTKSVLTGGRRNVGQL
jgi:hypothetical protein